MNILLIALLVLAFVILALVLFTARVKSRVEAALPPQGRFIDVPNARLHVVEKGPADGIPLLLIHGLAGVLNHFSYRVVDLLATQYRIIAVDRPGSGYSTRPADAPAHLHAQADVMVALMAELKLERAVVVGHSLGGAVALALAQRHPQKVAALALIAPLTHMPSKISPAFEGLMISQAWLRRLIAWTLALPMSIAKRDEILAIVFGPDPVPKDFGTRGGGLLGVRPSHFIAASTDLAAIAQDLPAMAERYAAMQLPVGVLYGRGDRILNPSEQGEVLMSKLPGAELSLVDGGHMLPITAPERTADFIQVMAERTRSSAPAELSFARP